VGVKLIDGQGFLPESKEEFYAFVVLQNDRALQAISKSKSTGKYYAQQLAENETGKVDFGWRFYVCETDLYQELGGFDENCFMYSDDVDVPIECCLKENRTITTLKQQ
jgi:GT2 family glycosyltransferase